MSRKPRRVHLDAGPDLHPMTLIDLFYFIVERHGELIEAWDRSRHEVWCTCGTTPQVYADPRCNRPTLLAAPPCRRPCCADGPERPATKGRASDRQLELDLGAGGDF